MNQKAMRAARSQRYNNGMTALKRLFEMLFGWEYTYR